jgi:hypothetical protein
MHAGRQAIPDGGPLAVKERRERLMPFRSERSVESSEAFFSPEVIFFSAGKRSCDRPRCRTGFTPGPVCPEWPCPESAKTPYLPDPAKGVDRDGRGGR